MKKITTLFLLAIITTPLTVFGALDFGVISNRIDLGDNVQQRSLSTFTYIAWVKPTSYAANYIVSKRNDALSNGHRFIFASPGFLRLGVDRATTDVNYIASSRAVELNVWNCVAVSFDINATPTTRLYRGSATTTIDLATNSTATNGAGALVGDSGISLNIGNVSTTNSSLRGTMGPVGMFNRVLSLGEIRSWCYFPRVMSGSIGFYRLGFTGLSTQTDWSGLGLNGTITGATTTPDAPLRSPFGF